MARDMSEAVRLRCILVEARDSLVVAVDRIGRAIDAIEETCRAVGSSTPLAGVHDRDDDDLDDDTEPPTYDDLSAVLANAITALRSVQPPAPVGFFGLPTDQLRSLLDRFDPGWREH